MASKRRTFIVCTIGPASASPNTLEKMARAGMDIARLNFSHATREDHKLLIRAIRAAAKRVDRKIQIIADMQGPKIRLGNLPEDGIELTRGAQVVLTTATTKYDGKKIPVTYRKLHKDVKKGHRILIEDGIYELKVMSVKNRDIRAKVINGGTITSRKGMNFPDSRLNVCAVTGKDRKDAAFAVEQGVDWIALSFVTSAAPIKALRKLIAKHTHESKKLAKIIVKIEKHEAIERFDEILVEADAIMIARGDLGVEIDPEEVPIKQREIIERSRRAEKPVIVATQMLDSMIRNPRPTRAEVSDVANAVFDCATAVMLSGESAIGKYPVKAVRMMAKIIKEAEESCYDDQCDLHTTTF